VARQIKMHNNCVLNSGVWEVKNKMQKKCDFDYRAWEVKNKMRMKCVLDYGVWGVKHNMRNAFSCFTNRRKHNCHCSSIGLHRMPVGPYGPTDRSWAILEGHRVVITCSDDRLSELTVTLYPRAAIAIRAAPGAAQKQPRETQKKH
jgi:hypothetical protein